MKLRLPSVQPRAAAGRLQGLGRTEDAREQYRRALELDPRCAGAHNNLGVLYQNKGLYDEAIREFQRATFIDPHYDKARNNLGVALRGLRERVTLAVHVGCVDDGGQARATRDIRESTAAFEERLANSRCPGSPIGSRVSHLPVLGL